MVSQENNSDFIYFQVCVAVYRNPLDIADICFEEKT